MSEAGLPLRRIFRSVRNCFQIELSRVFAAHENRKRIVKAERRTDFDFELFRVLAFYLIVNSLRIGDRFMVQDRRECSAGVFRIEIDLAGSQCRVRQVSS